LAAFAVFLGVAFTVFCRNTDDPFITYRYAKNLVRGYGPVFNAGERVEGFTSPLHMLVSALLLLVVGQSHVLFAAKLFGIGCSLVAIGLVYSMISQLLRSRLFSVAAALLLASNPWMVLSSVNGLETAMTGMLVAIAARLQISQKAGHYSRGLPVVAFLICAARPEGFLLAVVMLVYAVWWTEPISRRKAFRA